MTNVLASNNSNRTADSTFLLHSCPDILLNTKMHYKNKIADQTANMFTEPLLWKTIHMHLINATDMSKSIILYCTNP